MMASLRSGEQTWGHFQFMAKPEWLTRVFQKMLKPHLTPKTSIFTIWSYLCKHKVVRMQCWGGEVWRVCFAYHGVSGATPCIPLGLVGESLLSLSHSLLIKEAQKASCKSCLLPAGTVRSMWAEVLGKSFWLSRWACEQESAWCFSFNLLPW